MRKIDQATVQRILDTADIVEVVSDYVQLKRAGSGYKGLCPFHNERTPSFSVSKSKGLCKCFSCGEGGSPVSFIMKIEQVGYTDALRILARKYGIEIEEREETPEEREAASQRESMLAISEFAAQHFQHNLNDTVMGRDIGLSYFRERGIDDRMIERFRLGYSLENKDELARYALKKGYKEEYLINTGLCYKKENGELRDRFRGRVIFPIFSISGKVLGFGGRTLRKDKTIAKYVNSPTTTIYVKENELYGLYQAKQSIVKKGKCILVEGYMDVISMHQSGVENVVASSGTSLTHGQIRLIHRFTEDVTVVYDSDAAGIKASLRGIDMLLAEGLNVRVLQLPEGDDPDSFAQSHSSSEVEAYFAEHETDFIRFKTSILLKDVKDDPIVKANVITDVVRSIACIPNPVKRIVYIDECSRMMGIDANVISLQVSKYAAERQEKEAQASFRQSNMTSVEPTAVQPTGSVDPTVISSVDTRTVKAGEYADRALLLAPHERNLLRYALKYGLCYLCDVTIDEDGTTRPMNVLEYIRQELQLDEIGFINSSLALTFEAAVDVAERNWTDDFARFRAQAEERNRTDFAAGVEEIRHTAHDLKAIEEAEAELSSRLEAALDESLSAYRTHYIEHVLCSSPDDEIRRITTDLVAEKYQLSKIHTKFARIETEFDRLADLVPRAIYELKEAILECDLRDINEDIRRATRERADFGVITSLMRRHHELTAIKKELAKYLGERVVSPLK